MNDKTKKLVEEGYYDVKPQSHGADLSKQKGTPFVWVKFENGLFWQGFFTPDTIQKTTEQLSYLKFRGSNPDDMNTPGAINTEDKVNICVKHVPGKNGETVARVEWINKPYEKKQLTPETKQVLKGIDLRGYMAKANESLANGEANADQAEPKAPW